MERLCCMCSNRATKRSIYCYKHRKAANKRKQNIKRETKKYEEQQHNSLNDTQIEALLAATNFSDKFDSYLEFFDPDIRDKLRDKQNLNCISNLLFLFILFSFIFYHLHSCSQEKWVD